MHCTACTDYHYYCCRPVVGRLTARYQTLGIPSQTALIAAVIGRSVCARAWTQIKLTCKCSKSTIRSARSSSAARGNVSADSKTRSPLTAASNLSFRSRNTAASCCVCVFPSSCNTKRRYQRRVGVLKKNLRTKYARFPTNAPASFTVRW